MNLIENINIIESKISNWKTSDIAYIKAIALLPSPDYKSLSLEITFLSQSRRSSSGWPDLESVFDEISLSFYDVSNLKLNFDGTSIPQITGFDIIDVSNQGWEGVNFQIEDYENGIIYFNCREIEAKSTKPAITLNW